MLKRIYKTIKIYCNKLGSKKRNAKLKNKDFTIISNNCYAGLKYENLNLEFSSPTIGLYFYAPEYIKFIKNLKHYCTCDIEFINPESSKYYNELKKRKQLNKIIGKVDDVEIVFLHYNSKEEVRKKWKKRCERINYDFLIYKFNDQNLCTYNELKEFHQFEANYKICFTAKKYNEFSEFVQIKKYQNCDFVKDDAFFNNKYLDFVQYINNINNFQNKGKIKILHVLNTMHMGGAENLVMNLYRKIDKSKFQFDFVVAHNGYFDEEIRKMGGCIYYLPEYKFYNHFKYKKSWVNFFQNHDDYDIVHGHTIGSAAIYLKIAKKRGIKTICHCHTISNGGGIKKIIKKVLQKGIPNSSDCMVACSQKAAEWLYGNNNLKLNNCIILNNAIDFKKYYFSKKNREKIRKKNAIKNNDIVIGHIGRFVSVKNHMFLLKVFEKLFELDNKYRLIFIGDGPLKSKIVKYVKKQKYRNNIIFIDSTSDIHEYYSAFDVMTLPSKYEGLGMVLIEAQINGLNCVASNNVPKDVIISNKINFLELKIQKWVYFLKKTNYKHNRSLINLSENFNIDKVSKQLESVYSELIKDRR